MKTISTLLLFFGILVSGYSQNTHVFDFENINDSSFFDFRTNSQDKNIWQIGKPKKNVFVSGQNSQHALVTDTSKSYPVKNVSSFKIHTYGPTSLVRSEVWCTNYILNGYYWVDSDSLSDFGKIEFSIDSGKTYLNLLTDSRALWKTSKPILTGRSKEWKMFAVDLRNFIKVPPYNTRNPIYKFSFISDNIDTKKDGLMFDKLSFCDLQGGLLEYSNNESLTILPNPANETISVQSSKAGRFSLDVYSTEGNNVFRSGEFIRGIDINISALNPGIYELILRNENGQIQSKKRFLKN
ncbi:MAG: T9SS type A sorting domain-containing protein [Opitutaceae bacterium]|nr:T9SS type A sorting domain-containing protein [Cytophagales bacterium]